MTDISSLEPAFVVFFVLAGVATVLALTVLVRLGAAARRHPQPDVVIPAPRSEAAGRPSSKSDERHITA